MKGKIHESKGNAWLSGKGNEHLHVQTSKRHVLHFYKYFKPIPAIWNIIKHLQLHSIFNSMNLFSHFPKKPLPNTGPGVTVSKKTLGCKHGRAWRPPLLCVYYFHNVILSKVFLKITFHSLKIYQAVIAFSKRQRSHSDDFSAVINTHSQPHNPVWLIPRTGSN